MVSEEYQYYVIRCNIFSIHKDRYGDDRYGYDSAFRALREREVLECRSLIKGDILGNRLVISEHYGTETRDLRHVVSNDVDLDDVTLTDRLFLRRD